MEQLSKIEIPEIQQGKVQEGIVRLVQYDLILNDYAVWLDHSHEKFIIPRQELEIHEIKGNLNNYIGKKLKFNVIGYDDKRDLYIGSCKALKLEKQQELVKRLRSGEEFDARIIRLVYFGAYLSIDDMSVIIRNRDFANDYTTISDVCSEGEIIRVKLLKITQTGKINVQAVEKYENVSMITVEDFKPHTVVYGLVRNVKSWACFVNIAPNLDAICPVPTYFNVKEGMKVAFRINQVRKEDGRIRGKIIKIIEEDSK